jgi:hypothetical protein
MSDSGDLVFIGAASILILIAVGVWIATSRRQPQAKEAFFEKTLRESFVNNATRQSLNESAQPVFF